MAEMKKRITSWQSTFFGVVIIGLLGYCIHRAPQLAERPELLIALGTGIYGILIKDRGGDA